MFSARPFCTAIMLMLPLIWGGAAAAEEDNMPQPEDVLRRRALNGEVEAQLELGQEFFLGKNRKKNPVLACYYFKQASDSGSPEGMFNYAVCCEQGLGTEKNLPLAFMLYKRAAAKGLAAAEFQAGRFLLIGVPDHRDEDHDYPGTPANREEAEKYFRSAAAKNFIPAANELALLELGFSSGSDTEITGEDKSNPASADEERKKAVEREAKAMEFLLKNLPASDGRSWRKLADAYYAGKGGRRNPEMMFKCLLRSAEAGDPEGMAKLAYAYQYGDGTEPDLKKAFEYFSRSAAAGHPGAVAKMGEYYLTGDFVKMDLPEARKHFETASKAGSPAGLYQFGRCLLYGWGGEKSEKDGLDYVMSAAKSGELRAQKLLARFYQRGEYLPKDPSGAVYWYKKAAMLGDAEAMRCFAVALEKGEGVEKDSVTAKKLLEQAVAMGDVEAAIMLGLTANPIKNNDMMQFRFRNGNGSENEKGITFL